MPCWAPILCQALHQSLDTVRWTLQIPLLTERKLSLRKVSALAQGHTVTKWSART